MISSYADFRKDAAYPVYGPKNPKKIFEVVFTKRALREWGDSTGAPR
jgi:hypothetical protein